MQNDAPQHNDNAPANGTSDTQPENNRDMPGNDAGGTDGGNQDAGAPKNTESQDGKEGNAVSEDTGMQASPPSEKNEHTEVAMNSDEKKPQPEAEDSDGAGQDGMQADETDGRQDAEGGGKATTRPPILPKTKPPKMLPITNLKQACLARNILTAREKSRR
ncbi:hypothetical protein [Neisseria lactamica]|uniref:hypothetical protein n=1 Tax=Neisseria lactamica TaxID=486 RepID=UPI001EFD5AA3|nr:hypothetical protein [Neisseria lactamica]